uniref:Protein kinase domain-containing protein n=1 Tax=Arcella intermedia TaxID=1963864 RepID=A0A6B2L4R5_9EUKA
MVALKILETNDETQERYSKDEIEILKTLADVKNVVNLWDTITIDHLKKVVLIFEYMEYDLSGLLSLPNFQPSQQEVKVMMYQLLTGLGAVHEMGFMHRDIKTANILVNREGVLKIGDFGTATNFVKRSKFHAEVCTLWYRPPELLLGCTSYGPEIDIWACACIFVELATHKSFLRASEEMGQLDLICKFFGTPISNPVLTGLPLGDQLKNLPVYSPKTHSLLSSFDEDGFDLLMKMFSYTPKERPNTHQCLNHPFFTKDGEMRIEMNLNFQEIHGYEAITKEKESRIRRSDDGYRERDSSWRDGWRDWSWRGKPRGRNKFWRKRERYWEETSPKNEKKAKTESKKQSNRPYFSGFEDPFSSDLFALNPNSTTSLLKPYFPEAHLLLVEMKQNNNPQHPKPNGYLLSPLPLQ